MMKQVLKVAAGGLLASILEVLFDVVWRKEPFSLFTFIFTFVIVAVCIYVSDIQMAKKKKK